MAKYSKHVRESRYEESEYPKIYFGCYGWTFLRCGYFLRDKLAQEFCYKLNNAAPKRGLKA